MKFSKIFGLEKEMGVFQEGRRVGRVRQRNQNTIDKNRRVFREPKLL